MRRAAVIIILAAAALAACGGKNFNATIGSAHHTPTTPKTYDPSIYTVPTTAYCDYCGPTPTTAETTADTSWVVNVKADLQMATYTDNKIAEYAREGDASGAQTECTVAETLAAGWLTHATEIPLASIRVPYIAAITSEQNSFTDCAAGNFGRASTDLNGVAAEIQATGAAIAALVP